MQLLLQQQQQQKALAIQQQQKVEDYSEFLAESPKATLMANEDEGVERGCVADFANFLCCAADESLVKGGIDGAMHQELNEELRALRQSTVDAKRPRFEREG